MHPATIALSNARQAAFQRSGVVLSNDVTSYPHGTVCLSNDSLLRSVEQIEELNLFAASYDAMTGNGLARLRDYLTPPRPGNSRIVRLTTYNENEPWESVDFTKVKRGLLADFAEVRQRTVTKSDLQINNRGLSVILDRDELKDKPEWQQVHTKWLIDLLNRATVLEALAIFSNAAIAGAKTWSSGANLNPDLDIRGYALASANITGFYPQNVAYGDAAFLLRASAYENELTAGSMARAGIYTEEQLATALGVSSALINMERYQNTATAKQELIGSNVLIFTGLKDASPMDASNLVRHVANGAGGGGEYAVYISEMGVKKIMLTVENYEYLHVQHTSGIFKIAIN